MYGCCCLILAIKIFGSKVCCSSFVTILFLLKFYSFKLDCLLPRFDLFDQLTKLNYRNLSAWEFGFQRAFGAFKPNASHLNAVYKLVPVRFGNLVFDIRRSAEILTSGNQTQPTCLNTELVRITLRTLTVVNKMFPNLLLPTDIQIYFFNRYIVLLLSPSNTAYQVTYQLVCSPETEHPLSGNARNMIKLPRVNFINPFMLCTKLLHFAPNF